MNVQTAFLHGYPMRRSIYMEHPKGYEVHVKMHLVCKLKKSFYGLKQCHPSAIKNMMLILGAMKKCLDGILEEC